MKNDERCNARVSNDARLTPTMALPGCSDIV